MTAGQYGVIGCAGPLRLHRAGSATSRCARLLCPKVHDVPEPLPRRNPQMAFCHMSRRSLVSSSAIMGTMPKKPPAGLVITPGAGAGREHSGLVAIDDALSARGISVDRVEFPAQAAGKRRTDPPAVCIATVRQSANELATKLGVTVGRIAVGGRSFGGRMCSMAVAEGLKARALVLVSYPLHPPGRPDQLRSAHFSELSVPCLFVSGRRDAFATQEELERETAAIPGPVTLVFIEGDHGLRKGESEAAAIVGDWISGLRQ
jgi:uncharacterized protein